MEAGADGITFHLREDRRHIKEEDIFRIKEGIEAPVNFEIAARDEMLLIASRLKPNAVCIVPEKREELTTEGGLNVCRDENYLTSFIGKLKNLGIKVSLFIEADYKQIDASLRVGADILEFHTGFYSNVFGEEKEKELQKITKAVYYANDCGLECHAGHGLTYDNVSEIAAISFIKELNIGFFIIGESLFSGFEASVKKMRYLMDKARLDY